MIKKTLTLVWLTSAMAAGTALAQTNQPNQAPGTAPTTSTMQRTAPNQDLMLKGSWRASKVIGLAVYNEANERLGDINELILDKDGKVNAVVIGVGGFLGMGEHDIAIGMDKLRFVETPVRSSSTAPATTERRDTTTTSAAPGTTERRDTTTTGAATTTTTTTTNPAGSRAASDNDWAPDHAVMNGTKDQLKAMKPFKYSSYN